MKKSPQAIRHGSTSSFTLIELVIAISMIAIAICGLIGTYIGSFVLNETSRNMTLAMNAAQAKIEFLREQSFDDLPSYDNTSFDVNGFHAGYAKGHIDVLDTTYTGDLVQVRVTVSWRQRGGRVIGEDTNLNGVLDANEDSNHSTLLDSPAEATTFISR